MNEIAYAVECYNNSGVTYLSLIDGREYEITSPHNNKFFFANRYTNEFVNFINMKEIISDEKIETHSNSINDITQYIKKDDNICTNCGNKLRTEDKFCSQCGNQII